MSTIINRRCVQFAAVAFVVFVVLGSASQGAIVSTITGAVGTEIMPGYTNPVDLINSGAPTLLATNVTGFSPLTASTLFPAINNGSMGSGGVQGDIASDGDGTYTATFTLDTTLSSNMLGWDITSIQSISGWTNNRFNQRYEVLYNTVDNASFVSLGTYATAFASQGTTTAHWASMVLTDNSGVIATGVKELRFNFSTPTASGSLPTAFRELDIFGVATIAPAPEPTTGGILFVSLLGCFACRRSGRKNG